MAARRPEWWIWDLEITPHLEKRMADREFSEVDLRAMMEDADEVLPDVVEGRWVVRTRLRNRRWEVVVEPDAGDRLLVVVTAYPPES